MVRTSINKTCIRFIFFSFCTVLALPGAAQGYDEHSIKMLQWHLHEPGKTYSQCTRGNRFNYGKDSRGEFSQNFGHCDAENRWCANAAPQVERWSDPAFVRCTEALWSAIRSQNWKAVPRLAAQYRNGEFNDHARDKSYSTDRSIQSSHQPPASNVLPSESNSVDEIDGSDIEMLDIEEEQTEARADPPKYCECYGDDPVMFNGLCSNDGNPDSPHYGSRDASGRLTGPLYEKGRYEWTPGCKATAGGRVNLREWHNNYNGIER